MTLSMIATIVAAVIAAFLLLRLYMVLGRRTGSESSPPDTVSTNIGTTPLNASNQAVALPSRTPIARDEIIDESEPMSLERQIALIHRIEPEFNERQFLLGARSAFSQIVKAFNERNEGALKSVLSPKLFDSFCQAMREKTEENRENDVTDIRSFDQVEIISARVESSQNDANHAHKDATNPDLSAQKSNKFSQLSKNWFGQKNNTQNNNTQKIDTQNSESVGVSQSRAQNNVLTTANPTRSRIVITVRFITSQVRNRPHEDRNENGQLPKGEADKPIEMVDIWVFARQALSPDPNWVLIGTRGE